ncbi:hypothetical protein BC831DRAFT_497483 [Entophlyctis helioformis]|nr:hypothetical protein BC831DRAFT_497483 [Entophlyctis helioformis]
MLLQDLLRPLPRLPGLAVVQGNAARRRKSRVRHKVLAAVLQTLNVRIGRDVELRAIRAARPRESFVDLTPILEPRQGLLSIGLAMLWIVLLYAAGVALVASGVSLLPLATPDSAAPACFHGLPADAPLGSLPCAAPAFRRLLFVSFDEDAVLSSTAPSASGAASSSSSSSSDSHRRAAAAAAAQGGATPVTPASFANATFDELRAVRASTASANGLLFNVEAHLHRAPLDGSVSALSGVHARLPESLARLVISTVRHDSFPAHFLASDAALPMANEDLASSNADNDDNDDNDADNDSDADAAAAAGITSIVSPFAPVACFGDGAWQDAYPSVFVACNATKIVPRLTERLATKSYGFIAAHVSRRDLHETSGLDGFLARILPLVDADTLAVVVHYASDKSHVLFHSARFSKSSKAATTNNGFLASLIEGITSGKPTREIDIEDVAPTVSTLLGMPIPFANEGMVIPEILWHATQGTEMDRAQALRNALRRNAEQVQLLANATLPDDKKDALANLFGLLDTQASEFRSGSDVSSDALFSNAVLDLQIIRTLSQEIQASYSPITLTPVVLGAIVILSTLLLTVMHLFQTYNMEPWLPDETAMASITFGAILGMTNGFTIILDTIVPGHAIVLTRFQEAVFMAAMAFILTVFVLKVYDITKPPAYVPLASAPSLPYSLFSVHAAAAAIATFFLVASPLLVFTSVGMSERNAVLYGLQAFIALYFGYALLVKHAEMRDGLVATTAFIFVLVRLGLAFDAQSSPFFASDNEQLNTAMMPSLVALVNFLLAGLVTASVRRTLYDSDNLHAVGGSVGGFFTPMGLFISAFYWLLENLHNYPGVMAAAGWTINFVQFWTCKFGFMSTSLASLYSWGSDPNVVGMEVLDGVAAREAAAAAGIALTSSAKDPKKSGKAIFFMGIANSIGASFFTLFMAVYMALNFLQPSVGSAVLAVSLLILLGLLELFSVWRDKAETSTDIFSSSSSSSKTGKGSKKPAAASVAANTGASSDAAASATTTSDLALRTVFANPYLVTGILAVLSLLVRYTAIASTQPPLFSLLAFRLPTDASLGYGGIRSAEPSAVRSHLAQLALTASNTLLLLARSYTPSALFGALAPILFCLWKRPVLRGGESRAVRELSFLVTVKFGLLAGAVLLADLVALVLAPRFLATGATEYLHVERIWDTYLQVFVVRAFGTVVIEGLVGVMGIVGVIMAMSGYAAFQRRMKRLGVFN